MVRRLMVIATISFLGLTATHSVQAADTQLILTWKAGTYAPIGFTGKLLPSSKSLVAVALSAFQSGKVMSLNNQMVRWYLNDRLVANGVGKTIFLTESPEIPGGDFTIRAEVPGLSGSTNARSVDIPNVSPHITLRPETAISSVRSLPLLLRTEPYYFNISDSSELKFDWSVNGNAVATEENPNWLRLSLPKGAVGVPNSIAVAVRVSHGSILETANLETMLRPGVAQ